MESLKKLEKLLDEDIAIALVNACFSSVPVSIEADSILWLRLVEVSKDVVCKALPQNVSC